MKQTKPIIHIYIPEALDHSNCEIWYFKHLFQRRLTKATLKYYAYPNRKEFETAFNQKKKQENSQKEGLMGKRVISSPQTICFLL